MAAQAKGVCPECGRTVAGRAAGPGKVDLAPHNRQRSARHPAVCLSRGARRRVPRVRDGRPVISAEGWTVPEALAQFAAAGMPLDETGFRAVVRAAHRVGTLRRVGEKRAPAGSKDKDRGGRGRPLYDIARLQQMHSRLVQDIPARDLDSS